MTSPFPDPSAVFGPGGESPQEDAPEGGQEAPQEGAEPPQMPMDQAPATQSPLVPGAAQQQPIDLEGAIAHAIEAGSEQAVAALTTSAADYKDFCQGVSFLAAAMKDLQPQPDPAVPAKIQADARFAGAQLQHEAQVAKLEADAAREQSRPAAPQSSARG